MTAAVWRPSRREAYPVLGVEGCRGEYVDAVVELPETGPQLITVPTEDIRVSPDRSIVSALTADSAPRFTDHSTPEGCRCAERDHGTPPPSGSRAGLGRRGSARGHQLPAEMRTPARCGHT